MALMLVIGPAAGAGLVSEPQGATKVSPPEVWLIPDLFSACWKGPVSLRVSPPDAHPGEVVTVSTTGAYSPLLTGSNWSIFGVQSAGAFEVVDYLGTPSGGSTIYGIISPAISEATQISGVDMIGPVRVRIPIERPGTYEIRRYFHVVGDLGAYVAKDFPDAGACLCARVRVLQTVPALVPADDIGISTNPASGLRDGVRVRVTLTGFGEGGVIRLSECAFFPLVTSLGCGAELAAQPMVRLNREGSVTAKFVVHSRAAAAPDDPRSSFACTTNCVLVATLGDNYADAVVRLNFAVPGAATGTFMLTEGVFSGQNTPLLGTVTFRASSGATYKTSPASDGEFSIVLPPGRYQATGQSPGILYYLHVEPHEKQCPVPGVVVVRPGVTTADVAVDCDVK